jgi:hypothetical protein
LKQLSLQQLGNIEVTTAAKEPEEVCKTAAAIYVILFIDVGIWIVEVAICFSLFPIRKGNESHQ